MENQSSKDHNDVISASAHKKTFYSAEDADIGSIEWNKVTWYSKVAAVIVGIVVYFLGYYAGVQYQLVRDLYSGQSYSANTVATTLSVSKPGSIAGSLSGTASSTSSQSISSTQQVTPPHINNAYFDCDGGKTISANFIIMGSDYNPGPRASGLTGGESSPPVPVGFVSLLLSDGRMVTLPQTLSADGARYANSYESLVFWTKGNGAFIEERDPDSGSNSFSMTYSNCMIQN